MDVFPTQTRPPRTPFALDGTRVVPKPQEQVYLAALAAPVPKKTLCETAGIRNIRKFDTFYRELVNGWQGTETSS
jgi:hypothetical protein